MLQGLKTLAKAAIRNAEENTYHRKMSAEAFRFLGNLKQQGKSLRPADQKRCDDYAVQVLGHQRYAPWLYTYTAFAGQFHEGWIPDNYYGWVVVPKLKGDYGIVSDLNSLNVAIFRSDAFPDVLSYVNGVFFDRDYRFVPKQDVADRLFKDHDRVVYKVDNASRGRGVYAYSKDTFDVQAIPKLGNGLFQGFIRQHDFFNQFTDGAVATIRMTTVCEDNGKTSLRGCNLRLGNPKETHVQSATQTLVPIDLNTGALSETAYTPDWIALDAHPTSQIKFAGLSIPNFSNCLEQVLSLHRQVPYARCIGWDITVDHEGNMKCMEWNAEHNGVNFNEATQGPCFADLGWADLHKQDTL